MSQNVGSSVRSKSYESSKGFKKSTGGNQSGVNMRSETRWRLNERQRYMSTRNHKTP